MSREWLRSGRSRPISTKMSEGGVGRSTGEHEMSTARGGIGDASEEGEGKLAQSLPSSGQGSPVKFWQAFGAPSYGRNDGEENRMRAEEERRIREEEWKMREEVRFKFEREERSKERLAQAEILREIVAQMARPDDARQSCFKVRLEPLDDKDDVDMYLDHFEKIAVLHGWPKEVWAIRLLPCLKGQARECVQRLSLHDSADYCAIKTALMVRFRKSSEFYRKRFRTYRKDEKESFTQAVSRIEGFATKWGAMEGCDMGNVEEVWDLFLREAAYRLLPPEVELKVRERDPRSAKDVGKFADVIQEARGSCRTAGPQPQRRGNVQDPPVRGARDQAQIQCYVCKRFGHVKRDCPKLKNASVIVGCDSTADLSLCTSDKEKEFNPVTTAKVNGVTVGALRDTGAGAVVVAARLVARDDWTGESVQVRMADAGICQQLRTARIKLESKFVSGRVVAMVMEDPSHDVIIGNKAELENGHVVKIPVFEAENSDVATAVEVTRSQATVKATRPLPVGKPRSAEIDAEKEAEKESALKEKEAEKESAVREKEAENSDVETAVVVTRSQATVKATRPLPVSKPLGAEIDAEKLKEFQTTDESLRGAREAADARKDVKSGEQEIRFVWRKGGLLFREYEKEGVIKRQVCVPKPLRNEVMRIGHDTPMAGHLGAQRTRERLWNDFYWPGMCADIRRYCRSCDRCQKVYPRGRVKKAPLGKLPLVGVPFERVAVDLIGPIIPASEEGHRFVLVMVDYATRYPEAVPLKSTDSVHVAEALLGMWARVGIPKEVLSDRGTQFVSDVMKQVHRLYAIRGLTTTPYHAQCNGLVERFNGTLKTMLKKLCDEKPNTWHRYIAPCLFAYREVPQTSTGFSPFELLYGRTVRGPMAVLRELWTGEQGEEREDEHAATYVVDLRNRIEETCKIVQENLTRASDKYKMHFDKKAVRRELKPGEEVLLLLPTKRNKLEMEWRGPYPVKHRKGEFDYWIDVGGKKKLYHVNMLKLYHHREEPEPIAVSSVPVIEEKEEWEEVSSTAGDIPLYPLETEETIRDIHLDERRPEIHEDIRRITEEFQSILTDLPKVTSLAECEILLDPDKPTRTRQYPLPFAEREVLKKEVDEMLRLGVIEKSSSPFSSPIILVKKKDGKTRFCLDFRRLNKQVVFDCEPMPDIDGLFAQLGKAKFLSKIDLTKGYWQIPMKEEDKAKTAFTTPQGHFQWTVMPFGLKTAGAIFSRMMRDLLQPLGMPEVQNFMDDILIATETQERHLECLRAVFARLTEVSLAAKPSKCHLGFADLDYLGHRVGQGRVTPDEDKMAKIRNAAQPTTKKQVRSFLGLVGFYRRFVPNFSEIALPLTEATRDRAPSKVVWSEQCERAFIVLKRKLCAQPVCTLPDFSRTFVLRTDASDSGLGAILIQDQGMGDQTIACASRKLNAAEKNYSTIEKELLAVVWGIQKFGSYLYGREFVLQSDHLPLQHLDRLKTTNSRLMRWAMQLQPYAFVFKSIPGRENVGADFLSRL